MHSFLLTVQASKRLIAIATSQHPLVSAALDGHTLVIVAGSTNGYVAEAILKHRGLSSDFRREGYHRGYTVAPGARPDPKRLQGDVIIRDGTVTTNVTIHEIVDELRGGDLVIKGANAFDPNSVPAVLVGHPRGGTIMAATQALTGHRVPILVPVGLEKRVPGNLNGLALRCNAPGGKGPRLFPFPGIVFTEIDAIKLLTGCDAVLLAAGGSQGAEGACWLGIEGDEDQLETANALLRSVRNEPPCSI